MDVCIFYYIGSFIEIKKKFIRCKYVCKLIWCDNSVLGDNI